MKSWTALPESLLATAGPVSRGFLERGIATFRAAGRHLGELPCGRNADPSDFTLVMHEGRGTRRTKHALLAALAGEQGIPLRLMLAIYEMTEANTPGVGSVLARYGLDCIPEVDCYVRFSGDSIDITRSDADPTQPIGPFLQEEAITPDSIGGYRMWIHHQFLEEWRRLTKPAFTLDELWDIQRECTAAIER
ncbi:MAG: hypothetical protein A3F84_19100 [Candidatus Handelsmanbacteria bacterium RIFCSPLOWO2_12_FULL_64_10]|uniref:Uncharacterized protein n=1 Tax=Handelsmanbacteria sp. (strain RIFCSPLOWO2_12_FULL_64_10) TaxID=1817868 RepID=A0A1F6C8N4_HANXR|nr:MAG: hypothetical protein A3F84_19100 [Candidatus Handelsmanbacteria bacterium RIFCSPLOWO2_12_FULL_64_10]